MNRRLGANGFCVVVAAGLTGLIAGLWTWTAPGDAALWRVAPDQAGLELSLLDNGFHTDLAVPRQALEARGGPLARAVQTLAPGDWILIGWGDAKFYVDQTPMEERLPDGARAFFRPGNPSVVMLDPAQRDPRALYTEERRKTFTLSRAGFDALAAHIEHSLDLSSGAARVATVRPGDDARFFASREHFWIGHLCNHWTAGVLNAAGLPVRPLRAVTSSEVMTAIEREKLDSVARRD